VSFHYAIHEVNIAFNALNSVAGKTGNLAEQQINLKSVF
jgi:hypothetical protein